MTRKVGWLTFRGWETETSWVDYDPLTISRRWVIIRLAYDDLCKGECSTKSCNVCHNVKKNYGSRVYKCDFVSCPYSRQGFTSKQACKDHRKDHARPWKCSVRACEWAAFGFETKGKRDDHWMRCHQASVADLTNSQLSVSEMDELQPLLFELVITGNVDELQKLLPHCAALLNSADAGAAIQAELLRVAASQGSLAIVRMLQAAGQWLVSDAAAMPIVQAAIKSQDEELVQWIMTKLVEWKTKNHYRHVIAAVIKSDSAEIFRIWEDSIAETTSSLPEYDRPKIQEALVSAVVLNAAKKFPAQEARLLGVWGALARAGTLGKWILGEGLINVAKSSCSITQAKALINLGAFVDYPHEWRSSTSRSSRSSRSRSTALHHAAKKKSAEAADLVKFLLLEGASANVMCRRRMPHMERGALGIHQWLGMTWDELVAWTQEMVEKGKGKEKEEGFMDLDP